MNGAFFWPGPTKLAIAAGQMSPEGSHVGGDGLEIATLDQIGERLNRFDTNLVTTPNRESESVPHKPVAGVGMQGHIGGRIVRRSIHGIRAIQGSRGGKSNVLNVQMGNHGHRQWALVYLLA